jgi:hypothetical protein
MKGLDHDGKWKPLNVFEREGHGHCTLYEDRSEMDRRVCKELAEGKYPD